MKYEVCEEKFKELATSEKLTIFNMYCCEHGDPDKEIQPFDDEFFKVYFTDPIDAARATFFGKIKKCPIFFGKTAVFPDAVPAE